MSNFTKKTIAVWDQNGVPTGNDKDNVDSRFAELVAAGSTSNDVVVSITAGNELEVVRVWTDQTAAEAWVAFLSTLSSASILISATVADNV